MGTESQYCPGFSASGPFSSGELGFPPDRLRRSIYLWTWVAYPVEDVACDKDFYWSFDRNVADLGSRDCLWSLAQCFTGKKACSTCRTVEDLRRLLHT
jgi:hypothetical protein